MKKFLALTLAMLMLLALVACGTGTPADDKGGKSTEDSGTSTEENAGKDTDTEKDTGNETGNTEENVWPAAAIANLTEGKVNIPEFTGECTGFEVLTANATSVEIDCLDAELSDIKSWRDGLASCGFISNSYTSGALFRLSDSTFLKCSYAGEMITIRKIDETGKWPYYAMLFDLQYPVDDLYGVSDYTFAYTADAHTVTVSCENADGELFEKVNDSFGNSSNWDFTDTENVYHFYQRDDDVPDMNATVALNGNVLTVVITVD